MSGVVRRAALVVGCFVLGCGARRRGGGSGHEDEECLTGLDEDDDGLVDCFDPDCAGVPECAPREVCGDGLDDDHDGRIDCDDPDCSGPECPVTPESICEGGLDEDEDGAPDCDDADCAQDPACVVEDDVPGVDCADVCAHERECGTAVAADCDAACRCSVDEVFAPAFVDAYYGCRLATSCGVLGDDTCVEEVDDFPASDRADRFIAACTSRCAGIPCEYFKIYRDDVLDSIEPCLDGGDCVACFDQAAMGCP